MCTVTLLLRWRPSKICLTIFNVVAHGSREPRPGAPKTATTEDNVTKIHDLVLADRRLKIREIAETVGMSKDRVGQILHEILGIRKLSARWVPRLLTPDNKSHRETTSEQCLTLL